MWNRSNRQLERLAWAASFPLIIFACWGTGWVSACPICGTPTVTFSERLSRADAAVLVEWISAEPDQEGQPGKTTYEIVEVRRDPANGWKKGNRLTLAGYAAGKPGDLFLLLGRKGETEAIQWDPQPLAVTEMSYQYIIQAPSPEADAKKRLGYYLRFLEYPDVTIANDAHAEFVNASTTDIAAVSDQMPRGKLRKWIADAKIPINRQAAYGLMLGFCGGPDEARLLEQRIFDARDDRRSGIEGLMMGYLLLTGETGLSRLEDKKLRGTPDIEGDTYPALLAIRYFWAYGNDRISKDRLRRALRLLIDNAAYAHSAIKDLARWHDWSLQDRLRKLYGTKNWDDMESRKVIIKYLIASTKDVSGKEAERPQHAVAGARYLEELRQVDPKLVAETEKYFYLDK